MRLSFLLVIAIILPYSCTPKSVLSKLEISESVMEEHPDSALRILRSIPTVTSRRVAAKHAILHSRALDKCWIDVTSDSIIAPAVSYYKSHGSAEEKIMAFFYMSKIMANAGDYQSATIYLIKAQSLAEKSGSLYWKAMTSSAMGRILSKNYDVVGELESYQRAYDYWLEYGDSLHIRNAIFGLAMALHNNGFTDKADSLYATICARGAHDAYLYRAMNVMRRTEPDSRNAVAYYEKALEYGKQFTLDDYYLYALALSLNGEKEKAGDLIEQLSHYPINEHGFYSRYRIFKNEERYKDAMIALARYTEKSDSIVRVQLNQSINKSKSDYYKYEAAISEKEKINIQIFTIMIVTTLLLFFSILYHHYQIRRTSLEAENYKMTVLYEETKRMLEVAKADVEKGSQIENKLFFLRRSFANTYQTQFKTLSRILEKRNKSENDSDSAVKEYKRKIDTILREIRSPKDKNTEFEKILDTELDGIMAKLRKDYPKFKESDFQFLSYIIAGFDATTRAVITGGSPNNMRVIKSRLLKYINEHPTENQDLYRIFINHDMKSA